MAPMVEPGGQPIEVTASRVEPLWHARGSAALDERPRRAIRAHLARRIDNRGVLHPLAQRHRSRHRTRAQLPRRLARPVQAARPLRRPPDVAA